MKMIGIDHEDECLGGKFHVNGSWGGAFKFNFFLVL